DGLIDLYLLKPGDGPQASMDAEQLAVMEKVRDQLRLEAAAERSTPAGEPHLNGNALAKLMELPDAARKKVLSILKEGPLTPEPLDTLLTLKPEIISALQEKKLTSVDLKNLLETFSPEHIPVILQALDKTISRTTLEKIIEASRLPGDQAVNVESFLDLIQNR